MTQYMPIATLTNGIRAFIISYITKRVYFFLFLIRETLNKNLNI